MLKAINILSNSVKHVMKQENCMGLSNAMLAHETRPKPISNKEQV
jgi:hypothetical protein